MPLSQVGLFALSGLGTRRVIKIEFSNLFFSESTRQELSFGILKSINTRLESDFRSI